MTQVCAMREVAGKREPEQEREAQEWIEQVVGERFPPGYLYEDVLRDGIILCKLMNRLQPGIITKINYSGGDYKFMDNLNQYVYYLCCNTVENLLPPLLKFKITSLRSLLLLLHQRFLPSSAGGGSESLQMRRGERGKHSPSIARVESNESRVEGGGGGGGGGEPKGPAEGGESTSAYP
ncbi:hypothetical protein RUM43_001678 [Polyplax serrata]|uniref:Calponin-homology (CH) domain-containing protein n=1 Tax=Polyplax serrata TaxID=468196 RepID=A0AAN8XSJ5_POLSC